MPIIQCSRMMMINQGLMTFTVPSNSNHSFFPHQSLCVFKYKCDICSEQHMAHKHQEIQDHSQV